MDAAIKLPHGSPNVDAAGAACVASPVSTDGGAPVRLAMLLLSAVVLPAFCLTACSSAPVAPPGNTESAAMVEKNCNDPHWRDQNLGLWYSVCRPGLQW